MLINKKLDNFIEEGYVQLDFYNIKSLKIFKEKILDKLRMLINNETVQLENFHEFVKDDKEKFDIQYKINKMIWDEKLHIPLIQDNIDLYYKLVGQDLDIQSQPYLRIARPNCPQDNIGFHRDGFYGSSAYELSTVIPLVNLNEKSALQIEPKSHHRGPIPTTRIESKTIKKGDKKNQLGFQYAPKIIDPNFQMNPIPIPLKFGEALCFGLGTIHGQEINEDIITRWSMDVRVKNSFSPTGTKDGYYQLLSSSLLTQTAQIYYSNNET